MDRSWITCDRLSTEYRSGVVDFLDFAILNAENRMSIRCPCTFCCNMEFHTPQQVKDHLFEKGFLPRYIVWTWHGETDSKSTFTNCEDHSHSQRFRCHDYSNIIDMVEDAYDHCDRDPSSFKDMLEDAEKPLYPGAKHSKLSSLMRLYNVKGNYGWSDKGFSALLEVLVDILPNNNTLPMSMYEVKKTMKVLGLEYEKIHACPNDCILYRNEFADLVECPNCGASRLKRLFQSPQTAQNLTWHANKRIRDGKLRHPADSPAWQLIDNKWPKFAQEPRNLRLALSTDGVNPHSTLSTTYSCWPVILITYNLPPWLCMKRKFLMLSLLISGPKQPGNDLDVYLAPLIEDLKTLWDVGIDVYDSYRKETFNLRAVLMWTISDFPAYGNLSGCTVKGYYACPICGIDTCACWLPHSRKMSYIDHRRFLPLGHLFRKLKKVFNGKQEWNEPPKTLSGEEIFNMVEDIDIKFGKKKAKKQKHDGGGGGDGDENITEKFFVKTSTGVQIDNDQQSPETLGKRKADFPSGKSTPKSVKSKIKDSPTTISPATPQQTPEKVDAHWVLLAIDMVRRTTDYLDPLEGSPDEELTQIVNQGIRIHQSLNSDTKANVQWIPVKFKGVEEYTVKDLSRLRDQWATYVAKLITAYNHKVEKK
ncbi:uncharacterized protein LOC112099792 [Citrus clementina]|uniref:uncharacterized protein LOC112099792 n=1 Tax=Citrus clementina TaxID=85681 RepID=UPI000CED43AA|nr:uncharacterized protein LOC112099792 [Citrus x clementina]